MHATLMFITDIATYGVKATFDAIQCLCGSAIPGSVAVQVRDTQLEVRARLQACVEARALTRDAGQYLYVNDRLDLAVLSQADGIHLGENSVAPSTLREAALPTQTGPRWISRAWHAPVCPPEPGADCYVLSPVVAPRKGVGPLGIARLQQLARAMPGVRIYALGGVDARQAPSCIAAGAAGVAVIGSGYTEPLALLTALGIQREAAHA